MWTPRRLLLMILSFIFCFGAYQVYAFFLGHYDGLPPLPPEYRHNPLAVESTNDTAEKYESQKHEIAKLLERAFGPKCAELNRSRNIEIGKPESRTVFAFDNWTLEDGILRMTNVSMANFKKIPAEGKQPEREEIVTLQGEIAVIKFNQPIKNLFDLKPSVKPIAGHVEGEEIKLTHNHGTSDRSDDITMYCKKRIDFVDEQKRIWSDGKVLVVYAFPPEAKFEGVGLQIILANELVAKSNTPTNSKSPKSEKPDGIDSLGISSVKSIRLDHDVEFNFFKLQGSLLGGNVGKADDKKELVKQQQPAQPMVITCKNEFVYDMPNNLAIFNTQVNALRHRSITTNGVTKHQYDELNADERLTLELIPPKKGKDDKKGPEEEMQQFELKKAVATGKLVKVTANEDGTGTGLYAEGIELICDMVAHEARLRGKEQVNARVAEYDITAHGIVKILLPEQNAQDKDPRGLIINGAGDVKLRPSALHPDPYTLASWEREMQWHRTTDEHRVELYGNAVLMHEKQGRMSGEIVKAWLVAQPKKTDEKDKTKEKEKATSVAGVERLDGKLKRVEVEQRVNVLSTRFIIPLAKRIVLNFSDAPAGFALQKSQDGFDAPAPGNTTPAQPGKAPAAVPAAPPPVLFIHADEIDGDIMIVNDKQYLFKRLEARDNVHVEQKSEPGKQNGIDIHGQRLEMSLQGNSELYRIKLFGNKATIDMDKYGLEGQEIDLDQTENRVTIPGPGKFRFLTDRDFQGNVLPRPELVNVLWDEKMEFGGRAAQFIGSVIAEQGVFHLSCYSMTVTLDKTMTLTGKAVPMTSQAATPPGASKDAPNSPALPGIDGVICISNTQNAVGRVNPVVIEQRIKPGTPERYILRIEGVQVAFDNSTKNSEIIKVYGPGEVNMVRAGKNQMADFNAMPGAKKPEPPKPGDAPLQLKLSRVIFEEQMEYRKSEGKLRFWKNVRFFQVPGDDVSIPLDEKRLPKDGIYVASERMEVASVRGPNNSVLHEALAQGNTEMRANQTSYIKADVLTYSELKGQLVMQGLGGNDALFYNQERPGAPFQLQRAKGFMFDLKTNELRVIDSKNFQIR